MKIIINERQNQLLNEQYGGRSSLDIDRLDFQYLKNKLGKKDSVKVGHNTFLNSITPYLVAIRFHSTNIVEVDITEKIKFNTNGWMGNPVTSTRMYKLIGCTKWNLQNDKGKYVLTDGHDIYPYHDNMKVLPNGDIVY